MRPLVLCLLLVLALPAGAQIYRYTDVNGNTVFTSQPPDGIVAEQVDLPPINSVSGQAPAADTQPSRGAPEQHTPYTLLRLSGLPDAEALRANDGNFSVDVELRPALRPGHRLRLLLDGQPVGAGSTSTRLRLTNVERGEHRLAVEVLSGERQLQMSDSVSLSVQRVNTSSPALRPPVQPRPAP